MCFWSKYFLVLNLKIKLMDNLTRSHIMTLCKNAIVPVDIRKWIASHGNYKENINLVKDIIKVNSVLNV